MLKSVARAGQVVCVSWCRQRAALLSTSDVAGGRLLRSTHKVKAISGREMEQWLDKEAARRNRFKARNREDGYDRRIKTAGFHAKFPNDVAAAMARPGMREHFVGRGINITKSAVSEDFGEIRVFWTTTHKHVELETEILLRDKAEDLRKEMERASDIGKIPKIVFVKDFSHTSSVYLEKEFDELMDREGSQMDEMATVTKYALDSDERLDEVLKMQKATNTLGLDRQIIYDDICTKLRKARATHRVSMKPGLDAQPEPFEGYYLHARSYEDESARPVKFFLADRKKQAVLKDRLLQEALQGDEEREPST